MRAEAADRQKLDRPAGFRDVRNRFAGSPFRRFTQPRLDEREQPVDDHGLFGPGSMTWRVHAGPMLVVGALRALVIEAMHPRAAAGLSQLDENEAQPLARLCANTAFIADVTYGDTATAQRVIEGMRARQATINGFDPVSNRTFDAVEGELLLWSHCVRAHSLLAAHRTFVEQLSQAECDRYLAEQVQLAALQGVSAADVPSSTREYREYFGSQLPQLCNSRAGAETIRFVTRPNPLLVNGQQWPYGLNMVLASRAAVTLMPRSLRAMAGLPAPGWRELAYVQFAKANGRLLTLTPRTA